MTLDIILILIVGVMFWRMRKLKKKMQQHHDVLTIHNSMFDDTNAALKNLVFKSKQCGQDRLHIIDSVMKIHKITVSNLKAIDGVVEHTIATTGFCPVCGQYLMTHDHLDTCMYKKKE